MHKRQVNPIDMKVDHIKLVGYFGYGINQERRGG
jgi:hypothetical protein